MASSPAASHAFGAGPGPRSTYVAPACSPSRLLIIHPDPDCARNLHRRLKADGLTAHTLSDAADIIAKGEVDAIVTQLPLPETRGFDAVVCLHALNPALPIIALTSLQDEQFALQALSLGAQEYLVENTYQDDELWRAISRAVERRFLEQRLEELSHLDPSTGLRNRALLRDRFDHLVMRARRERHEFAFAIISLPSPDKVALTELAENTALHHIGSIVSMNMRGSDTLARLTHNQLGLLLEQVPQAFAVRAVQRILSALAHSTTSVLERPFDPMALKVGLACFPTDGESVETLIASATAALRPFRDLTLGEGR